MLRWTAQVSDIPLFLHVSKRQKPPRLFDQNLHNLSVLHRPVRKIAWIRAAFACYGLPSSEVQMGWGVVSLRYCGWRYSKEGRSFASFDSFECQYSMTFVRQSFMKLDFGGGDESRSSGCGRQYWIQISRIFWNQECAAGLASTRVLCAMVWSGSAFRWHIIKNKESWRRWRRAVLGKEPARKYTTQSGVRSCSFISLWREFL